MWPIDSSLDESMKEQVLTMTTSAFSASGMTTMLAWCRWPTMISLSTRFLAQPREMRLTLSIEWERARRVRGNRPKAKNGGQERPPWQKRRARRGLLLLGGGDPRLLALQVGGAAFA